VFEIGSSLREARIRQGVDLATLEQQTKIRSKYLRALEDERFELLPAHTYVKGFLRAYADELGLDGQLYVDEYNSRYVVAEEEAPLRARRSPSRVPAARRRRRERRETGAVLLALTAIGLVTALVIAAWKFGGPDEGRVPGLQESGQPAAAASAKKRATTGTARISLWARNGDTGLEIRRGSPTGKVVYSGTLERGQTKRFTGTRLALRIGRPESVRVSVNGERGQLTPRWGTYLVTPNGISRVDPGP
jgi:Helix-turn-helix domain/RodZ C-terminal domain